MNGLDLKMVKGGCGPHVTQSDIAYVAFLGGSVYVGAC